MVAGALAGVILRLIFSGKPDFPYSAMNGAFIGFAPLAVGAVTVYFAERTSRRSWRYYLLAGMLANALFVLATMAILIEGLICAVLILPLFAVYGALGTALMGLICRLTNWPKPAVYSFAVLPLLLGALLPNGAGEPYLGVIERSVIVPASASAVWTQLHNADNIKESEVGRAWLYRIGVPLPMSGVTRNTPSGLVRDITMGKGIHFSQHATQWETDRYVKWTYHFTDDSFPAGALDDHVKIGGQYFDLMDTEYILAPNGAQSTELKIRMRYRVSTQFNWYAKRIGQALIGNFEEVILDFYARRAENGPRADTTRVISHHLE